MKVKQWLTVNHKGSCRLTKGKPSLDSNEIAIQLEVNLPDAIFQRPRLEATITVPDEAAVAGTIESAVAEDVQEAIEKATGLKFSVAVVQPETALPTQ